MSYTPLTTIEKIQAYFPGLSFTETTLPSNAEVDRWILQGTGIIYGALNERYVVPVTDESDLMQLEALADEFVCVNVRLALGRTQLREVQDGKMIPVHPNLKGFYERIKQYADGCLTLPNSLNAPAVMVSSYNYTNDIKPVGRKEEVQW